MDLVTFAEFGKTGWFLKFTALPFRNQTMYANESYKFSSIYALVLETAGSTGIPCLAVKIWVAQYGLWHMSDSSHFD